MRLNPNMQEVVKKEVLKLLDVGVIYPILDSQLVSSTQVVPKKAGITVVENNEGQIVPTRVTIGWRMCIDYRKLSVVIRNGSISPSFLGSNHKESGWSSILLFL